MWIRTEHDVSMKLNSYPVSEIKLWVVFLDEMAFE